MHRAGGWGLDSILCLRVIGRTNAKGINTPGKWKHCLWPERGRTFEWLWWPRKNYSIFKWCTVLSCSIEWRLNISDYSALLHLSWEFSIFFSLRYTFLVGKHAFSLDAFRVSSVGRKLTHFMLSAMEMLRIVPQGSTDVHNVLLTAADALIQGGRKDIFTPMFRLVLRKPL